MMPGMPPMMQSAGPMPGAPPGMMPPGMMPAQAPGGMDLNALIMALMQTQDPVALAESSRGQQDGMEMSPMMMALMGMMGEGAGQPPGPGMMPGGMMPGY